MGPKNGDRFGLEAYLSLDIEGYERIPKAKDESFSEYEI